MEKILMRPIRIKLIGDYIKCDKIIKDTDNPYYMRVIYYVLSGYIFDLFAEFFEENIEDYVDKEVCEWF